MPSFTLYPVPADQSVTVAFDLAKESSVTLYVMDISEKEVARWMEDKTINDARNEFTFNTK